MPVPFTLSGYSTALFSTWYFIEEMGLLFDAGDGVCSALTQKSRKINHAFISHADRDHITGLCQLSQLNAKDGFPKIYYPKDSGSFPALKNFLDKFDPHISGSEWIPLEDKASVQLKPDLMVQAIRNAHINVSPGVIKSFGFKVYETRSKLKPMYQGLSQQELVNLIKAHGRDDLHEPLHLNIMAYSGDTPTSAEDGEKWADVKVLIHEATFFKSDAHLIQNERINKHSLLEDVLEMAAQLKQLDKLVLGHFSKRYHKEEIEERVKNACSYFGIRIPVYCVLPGQTHMNLLKERPVFE